jgi:hypothetical protein
MGIDYSLNIGVGCTIGELFNFVKEKEVIKVYSDRTGERLKDREIEAEYLVPIYGMVNIAYFKDEKFLLEDFWQPVGEISYETKIDLRIINGSGEYPDPKDVIAVALPERKGVVDDWLVALDELYYADIEKAKEDWIKLFPNKKPRMYVGLSVSY